MRILVDTGSYNCANMGDVAMMQVTISRLSSFWPSASIEVITDNPDALAIHCPNAKPVPARGRSSWFVDRNLLGHYHRYLPDSISRRLTRLKRAVRRSIPGLLEKVISLKLKVIGVDTADLRAFMDSLGGADLIVACGMGGLTDHCRSHSMALLDMLETASRRDVPTAMFSQGLGPVKEPDLREAARDVLPLVRVLALREGRAALPLLDSLGVRRANVLITGDDAIEMAYEARTAEIGVGIGINLRSMPSAGVDDTVVERLRPIFHNFAEVKSAPLIPIPIANDHNFTDARTIRALLKGYDDLSDGGMGLDTPLKVIREVARCRIVVTGAYHGAVFALAQGIPAVCLVRSQYFIDKIQGLADQFGVGCEIVSLDSPELEKDLATALERAWKSADDVRAPLLEAAARQIDLSYGAYQKIRELILREFIPVHSSIRACSQN